MNRYFYPLAAILVLTFHPGYTQENKAVPQTITIPLNLSTGDKPLVMVLISAGTFTMGSPDSEQNRSFDEGPQHLVTITKSFYFGKYKVTQGQWQAVMGSNPSRFKGINMPVETVSWDDCNTFIQRLNALGQGTFRLPTEAEWEFVCRAGTTTCFHWGDDSSSSKTGQYAWYFDNSEDITHEIGTKLPNPWGVYDMSGNIWEWCSDWYGDYLSVSQCDPKGSSTGSYRVYRGGSFNRDASYCRSAKRAKYLPSYSHDSLGLRLVRSYP